MLDDLVRLRTDEKIFAVACKTLHLSDWEGAALFGPSVTRRHLGVAELALRYGWTLDRQSLGVPLVLPPPAREEIAA